MDDEETTPKQAQLSLDSEIFEEASTNSITDQPGMLEGTVRSVSILSATETNPTGAEIHQVDVTSSDAATLSNIAISSTADDSHGVDDVQVDEQHPTEDDPSMALIPPTYAMGFPIRFVDYGTYEPPPPPRPSWIQCICCCFLTAYYFHYAKKIRNSKYILFVLTALLVIPFSAVYFGFAYVGFCNLSPASPPLVAIMGFLGVGLISFRMLAIYRRIWDISLCKDADFQMGVVGVTIILMVIAIFAMRTFYTKYPNFYDPEDPVYCEKTYYYYIVCMNFVVLIVGIIGLLLHIPMKSVDPVQVVPLEYFENI